MANQKITDFTELTAGNVAPDDLLEIVDTSGSANKKVKAASLLVAGASGEVPFKSPTTSTLSTQRASSGSIANLSNSRGVRLKYTPPASDTNENVYALQAISSGAGGWEAIARLRFQGWFEDYMAFGVGYRDSGSGKSEFFGPGAAYAGKRIYFSADGTYAGGGNFGVVLYPQNNFWLKLKDDLTNRYLYSSLDGDFWRFHGSIGIGSCYITGQPTHVGVIWNPNYGAFSSGQSKEVAIDILSFENNALA